MNVNDMFPSNYLKASDLKGQAFKLDILRVDEEIVGDGPKWVVYFRNTQKGLVLNKTNAQVIANKYGPETDGWSGAEVELYPDQTHFKGQMVDCLRVRVPVPAATNGDEVPF